MPVREGSLTLLALLPLQALVAGRLEERLGLDEVAGPLIVEHAGGVDGGRVGGHVDRAHVAGGVLLLPRLA